MRIRDWSWLVALAGLLAGVVRAQTPDLGTLEMQQLRGDCAAQRTEAARQRVEGLRKLLDEQIENARNAAVKAKVSGNITAQAAATSAVRLFTEAKASFEKDGTYAIAGSVRHDLENTVDLYKRNAQVIEDKQTSALRTANKAAAARLAEILKAQKTPVTDDDKLQEILAKLVGTGATAAGATNAVTAAAAATNAAPAAPATVLGSSGQTANWTPLVRLEIVIHDAVEVVRVPLAGLNAVRTIKGTGAMDAPWEVFATPLQELTAGDAAPAFRAQSLPPLKPVDVLAWPAPGNGWTLEMRAKADQIPSRHGLVVEVDAAACHALGGAGAPAHPLGPPVKVHFETVPDGAYVLLGSRPLTAADSKPLLTPFECLVPVDTVDIRFRKRGCQDAMLLQANLTSNAIFRARLQPVPGFVERTVEVSAIGLEWVASGIKVKKGNQVRIAASGTWACGSGGEAVDADGYPNNDKFYKYYLDPARCPRLLKSANYGALLASVLPGGEAVAVGKQGDLPVAADGEIAFGINETAAFKHDNHGKLSVRVTVEP